MTARDLFTDAPAAVSACGTCGNSRPGPSGFVGCKHLPAWQAMSARGTCVLPVPKWTHLVADDAALAKAEAQAGIDRAAAAADREIPDWSARALEFIRSYARDHRGRQFIGHDIVEASVARGFVQPENSKAWGAPIQAAARAHVIRRIGFAPDPNRHTNPVPLWEAV